MSEGQEKKSSQVIDVGENQSEKTTTIKEISVDTQLIRDRLGGKAIGDVVPYSELNDLIGRDVQESGRGCLNSARRILQKEKRMVFGTIFSHGIKRLDDVSIVNTGPDSMKRIRRESRRGARRLACVADFGALPNDKKIEHNATVSMLGVLSHMTKGASIKRLEVRVQEANDKLAIGKTLEIFAK